MPRQRITAQDTMDSALNLIQKMQSEGWSLESMTVEHDYMELDKGKARLPVGAEITIRLTPGG